jgi:hypothetical protein
MIICNTGGLKSCLFIDNCIFGEKDGKRCDAALLRKNDKEIVWIELKMGMKVDGKPRTQRLKNRLFGESEDDPKGAFAQILASKTHFSSGFDLAGTKQNGFVSIPSDLVKVAVGSSEINKLRVRFKLKYHLNVHIGSKLELD